MKKKILAKGLIIAAMLIVPGIVMAHGPRHRHRHDHGNKGIRLATDIVNLVGAVLAPVRPVTVVNPAPTQTVVVTPPPPAPTQTVVVTPPPPPPRTVIVTPPPPPRRVYVTPPPPPRRVYVTPPPRHHHGHHRGGYRR